MGCFGYFKKSKITNLQNKLIKFIFHHADLGIILDKILEKDVLELIPHQKLTVIPNTLKDTTYIKNKFNNNEIKLLFCSNLLPGKGAVEFINSVIEISKLNKFNIKANIIGDYQSIDFYNELQTLSKPVEQLVIFKGLVIDDEKLKIFSESDIFVFPSYYELETFGLVNLEAMRAGLPVISTNHAAIPNIVINNKTGFIVPPRDIKELTEKIILLIENKELRIKYGMNGRERFLKYYNSNILEKKLTKIIERY
jgi:glycosyltransferase involved in cell wall biosynthesis